MRSKSAIICYNTTKCFLIYTLLIAVITGTSTQANQTVVNNSVKSVNRIETTNIVTNYANASVNTLLEKKRWTDQRVKSRGKRSIIQLAGMIRCVTGCDPFSYKSYGCYCGYLGAGRPVDMIDRCCLEHDWCYTYAACPQILIYFVPYQWSCITPGYARCGVVPFGGRTEKCSFQLCQCDRAFAKCLSQNPCPIEKPICQSSPIIAIQNIIVG